MSAPNVIVIMADQLKATALNLYGNTECRTPGLEKLDAQGVLGENAFPLCPRYYPIIHHGSVRHIGDIF